eukprot:scaffold82340_cov48-Phaeocystis_antarctica.AAC.4
MGAGKGYVLSWMSRSGYFPLENIVHVDPDHSNPNPNPTPSPTLTPPHPNPNISPAANQVDPDHFKRLMPEWSGYTAQSERAGNFCHRESGYLQEIAQEVRASSLPRNYCRLLLSPPLLPPRHCLFVLLSLTTTTPPQLCGPSPPTGGDAELAERVGRRLA